VVFLLSGGGPFWDAALGAAFWFLLSGSGCGSLVSRLGARGPRSGARARGGAGDFSGAGQLIPGAPCAAELGPDARCVGVGVAVGSAALDLRWLAMGDGENRVRTLHSLPPDFFRQGPIAIRRSSAAGLGLGLGLLLTFAARGARKGGAATDVLAGCPPRFLWGETCRVARGIFARGFREHDALRGGGRIFGHHPAHVAARGPWRAKNKRSNGAKRPQLLRGSDDGREAP